MLQAQYPIHSLGIHRDAAAKYYAAAIVDHTANVRNLSCQLLQLHGALPNLQ